MDEKIITLLLDCLHEETARIIEGQGLGSGGRISGERLAALALAEWQALLTLAMEQQVSVLLFHRLKALGLEQSAPPEALKALQEAYRRNAGKNLSLFGELRRIATALHAADIPVIVLKGAYLAGAVYSNLAVRELGDLDLLVHVGDLKRAAEILQAQGYCPTVPFDIDVEMTRLHQLPDFSKPDGARVELHWTITKPNTSFSIAPDELWERATSVRLVSADVLGLCAEDLLLHLCAHTSYHHYFEFGLRPSCDISELIHRQGAMLSWPQVVARARRWRWERGVYVALRLAKELLGAAAPNDVLQALRPASFDETLIATARTQLFTDRQAAHTLSPNLVRMWGEIGLWGQTHEFWRSLFLPRSQMASIYAVPLDSPRLSLYYGVRLKDMLSTYWRIAFDLWGGTSTLTPIAQRKSDLLAWLMEAPDT